MKLCLSRFQYKFIKETIYHKINGIRNGIHDRKATQQLTTHQYREKLLLLLFLYIFKDMELTQRKFQDNINKV